MRRSTLAFCLLALSASVARSASASDYLDDRSTPEALVASLYNAIDRREYARAFAYFATPPAKSLADYEKGFADTQSVEVKTGAASTEGAAGSTYYSLPVAIHAIARNGSEAVFAGCYTLKLADPQVQADDFTPLHIEKGEIKPSDKPFAEALPEKCGDGPSAPKKDAALEAAKVQFAAVFGGDCDAVKAEEAAEPESFDIEFNYPTDPQDQAKRKARLFRFPCSSGAYNQTHVFFLADDEGKVAPVHFAQPELDIRHVDDDPDKEVSALNLIGFTSRDRLANSEYDARTFTLTADEKWRGAGDASASGTWIFRAGSFSLVRYAVDASYDGEINPETVIDYQTGP